MISDEELVQHVLSGSPDAFNTLVEKYQPRVLRFLMQRVGNIDDAQEILQEVFLRTYLALERFDPTYRFSTWLYRIAINLSIDFLRKRRIITGELVVDCRDPMPNPQQDMLSKEYCMMLKAKVMELPEDLRLMVEMRHFMELSYQDMADTLDLPLGTVKNRLFRARKMLGEFMEENHE